MTDDAITILMTHWPRHVDRFDYFITAVHSLLEFLPKSTKRELRFLIGIEGRMPASPTLLKASIGYCTHRGFKVLVNHRPPGIGEVLNLLMRYVTTTHAMYVQDDFILYRPIPIDEDIATLEGGQSYQVVRYAAHPKTIAQSDCLVPSQPDQAIGTWRLTSDCFYYWSFNPFLAATSFLQQLYPFPSGRLAEIEVNKRLDVQPPKAEIIVRGVVTPAGGARLVTHIGTKSAILEKHNKETLRRQFGDAIPPLLLE